MGVSSCPAAPLPIQIPGIAVQTLPGIPAHNIGMPEFEFRVCPIPVPTNAHSQRQQELTCMGDFLAPDFCLAQPWLLWAFGE